jgi:hypothetical protein
VDAETTHHPVGTCKMGSDGMAVVDDQLRVHEPHGLRVAASVPKNAAGARMAIANGSAISAVDRRLAVPSAPGRALAVS